MCTVVGSKEAKLTAYAAGSTPAKITGKDADKGSSVTIYSNATGSCWGQRVGAGRIFYLQPGDGQDIIDAIDAGHAVELWGEFSGAIRINNASKMEVAK